MESNIFCYYSLIYFLKRNIIKGKKMEVQEAMYYMGLFKKINMKSNNLLNLNL